MDVLLFTELHRDVDEKELVVIGVRELLALEVSKPDPALKLRFFCFGFERECIVYTSSSELSASKILLRQPQSLRAP